MKQSSLDDHESLGMELDTGFGSDNVIGNDNDIADEYDDRRPTDLGETPQLYNNYQHRPSTPTPVPLPIPRGIVVILINFLVIM